MGGTLCASSMSSRVADTSPSKDSSLPKSDEENDDESRGAERSAHAPVSDAVLCPAPSPKGAGASAGFGGCSGLFNANTCDKFSGQL